jgi:hypothetical protein
MRRKSKTCFFFPQCSEKHHFTKSTNFLMCWIRVDTVIVSIFRSQESCSLNATAFRLLRCEFPQSRLSVTLQKTVC